MLRVRSQVSREPAVALLTVSPPGKNHGIARRKWTISAGGHRPDGIDSGNQWVCSDDTRGALKSERIFVVHRRIANRDVYRAVPELRGCNVCAERHRQGL